MKSLLHDPVARFVDDLATVLAEIAARTGMGSRDTATDDVALEAFNIAAAFIDVDGRHTDEELWALVTTFAPRSETLLQHASPDDVRRAGLVTGKQVWLASPSVLFDILSLDDEGQGTTNAWLYYEGAMAIAHAVCAIDASPARSELDAIDRFRRLLLDTMKRRSVHRPGASGEATAPEPPAAPAGGSERPQPIEELLVELDGLIGLEPVKAEVRLVTNLIRIQSLRRKRDLPVAESSRHLVFTGNPGTGKTTVARLLARIFRTLEVVEKGHLVETDRSQLVAGFVGQTAIQVRKVVVSALGGVLLIDEAYALARGDQRDFGQEATDTLVKLMEDHRDDLVVIAAGYTDEMARFIDSNPGLRSRFPKTIHFPDYSDEELVAIFVSMCDKAAYRCPDAALRLREWFAAQPRDKGFGNARLARNLFEASVARQATRLADVPEPTDDQLTELTPDDIGPPVPAA